MRRFLLLLILLPIFCWSPIREEEEYIKYPDKGVILLTFSDYSPTISPFGSVCFKSSGLLYNDRVAIQGKVADYFGDYDVIVTMDDSIFYCFPISHRVRCTITMDMVYMPTPAGWIRAGGIADCDQMAKGDTSTVVVSSTGLGFSVRNISDAIAHEVGHALGLRHQSSWFYYVKIDEYNPGNDSIAPIMGVSYSAKKAIWYKGFNSKGVWQNDTAIIAKTFRRLK